MSLPESCNGIISFFHEKRNDYRRMMVIVPHEDDEINLAGTVIYQARKAGIHVICVFLTNGDWKYPGLVRMKEAIQALAVLGVEEKDIIFLGYPDGGVHGERNVFVHGVKEALKGRDDRRETYGMETHADFAMQYRGHHQPYTRDGMIQDMKDVILCHKPDLILATDFDSHPDHRLCYFAFQLAMNEILHETDSYRPKVLMGFCYSTGFEGKSDFYGKHLLSSVINEHQLRNPGYETDNPPYEWNQRIRFPVPEDCQCLLQNNIIYKALRCHISQEAPARAVKLVNGDQVFWLRRTDNLIFNGKVSVSSGEGKYLHDFMMMNTCDITEKKPKMEDYLWIPESGDREKWCRCDFDKPRHVEAVVFYGNIDDTSRILKGRLTFSTGYSCEVGPFRKQGHENLVSMPPQEDVTWIKFEILEAEGMMPGISEWEILQKQEKPFSILQICVDGHFAYDWHIYPGEKPDITAYNYGISGELNWFLDGRPLTIEEINEKIKELRRKVVVRVVSKENPGIWCESTFAPAGRHYRMHCQFSQSIDQMRVWFEEQMEKWPHHQLKKIKTEKDYERHFSVGR